MRKQLRLLSLLTSIALCLMIGRASADDRGDARGHYQAGVQLYNGGDYRGAVKEFQAAQALVPADLNNYNLALCYDKLGDAAPAIQYYRAYLDHVPNTDKRSEIEASINRLDAAAKSAANKQADARPAAPPPPPAAAAPAPPSPPEPAPPAPPAPSVGVSGGVAVGAGASGTPQTGAPQSTGDAQLDQVQGIDINQLRAQRGLGGGAAQAPAQGQQQIDANGQVAVNGQPSAQGVPPAQGQQGQPPGPMANNPAGQPLPGDKPPAADPVYKKWWFWVVIGVSAYVIYEIASDSSQPTRNTATREDLVPVGHSRVPQPSQSGFTLLSW